MPGTDDLMAGYSNSIGGLMAGHNSMVSGLMANYNAGGGSGGGFMAGPAFTPGPGVRYGPGPMNPGGSGGGMPGMFGMESDDPETQRKLRMKRRLKSGKMDGQTPGMPDLPFGGFRAKGGPVRPGFKYLGGEFEEELLTDGKKTQVIGRNGPELFTPTKPAVVIPNAGKKMPSAANPINGLDSYFDGKSRTDFFGGAMKPGKQGRAYDEIRAEANGKAPAADPRSFSHPQGQNFAGPAAPPRSIDAAFSQPAAAPSGGEGRLVASSNGGVKWQAGSGAGFGAPPQSSTPAMRPIDAAFTDPPQLVRSGAKTVNANQGGPLSGRGTAGLQTGSLSMRGATPVGRSANNPQRIAEQMRRQGNPSGIFKMYEADQQRAGRMELASLDRHFQMGRDANHREQRLMDMDLERAFREADRAQTRQDILGAEQRGYARTDQLRDADRQQQLQDEERRRQFGLQPVPVPGTNTPYFQDAKGSIYTGSQPAAPEAPLPPGFQPKAAVRGGVQYGPKETPEPAKQTVPTVKEFKSPDGLSTEYREYNPATGKWRKVAFEDENNDGIDDRQQTAAPSTTAPAAPKQTASGIRFSRVQ